MNWHMVFKTGDLMQAAEPAIAHGCNTHGVMGAGVARLVREQHPEAFYAYHAACQTGRFRLGTAQAVYSNPAGQPGHWIYNLGTQKAPGADATAWGVFLSFANMAEDAAARGINEIALPRIGCGIGGLLWPTVEEAIAAALGRSTHSNLTLVVYDLPDQKGT